MWIKRQVVMLPTEEEANIFLEEDKTLTYYKHKQKQTLRGKGINLYILSDDEIKEGDYFIYPELKEKDVWLCRGSIPNVGAKKIIATTDSSLKYAIPQSVLGDKFNDYFPLPQPSQSFIEKYVEEYNKGNIITEVMVEYNSPEICENPLDSKFASLKVNPKDNTITIRKVKDSWSREEHEKDLRDLAQAISNKYRFGNGGIFDIDKWIEENF